MNTKLQILKWKRLMSEWVEWIEWKAIHSLWSNSNFLYMLIYIGMWLDIMIIMQKKKKGWERICENLLNTRNKCEPSFAFIRSVESLR